MVRQWREEPVQHIVVIGMQFDRVGAGFCSEHR